MKVKIHTADRKVLEAEAEEVVLPGWDGEFTAMDFHQPCLYGLRAGRIRVKYKNGKTEKQKNVKTEDRFMIKKGIAKIVSNELSVLVEM